MTPATRLQDPGWRREMRYAVPDRDGRPMAMLGFPTATWKTPPREAFIDRSAAARERNLYRMVDNSRFLVLSWIHIPNLASHIFAVVRCRLPRDRHRRHNAAPVLMETSAEIPRVAGPAARQPAGSTPEQRRDADATTRPGRRKAREGRLALPAPEESERNVQSPTRARVVTPTPNDYVPIGGPVVSGIRRKMGRQRICMAANTAAHSLG